MDFWDDEDELSDEEFEKERNKEKGRVNGLPIVKKAEGLMRTILAFNASVEDNEEAIELKRNLLSDISAINAKVRGAEAGEMYFLKMEKAVLVKIHAVSIREAMHAFDMFGFGNPEYLELIRTEIEEFRMIFIDWVASFDRTKGFGEDEWGLFN